MDQWLDNLMNQLVQNFQDAVFIEKLSDKSKEFNDIGQFYYDVAVFLEENGIVRYAGICWDMLG